MDGHHTPHMQDEMSLESFLRSQHLLFLSYCFYSFDVVSIEGMSLCGDIWMCFFELFCGEYLIFSISEVSSLCRVCGEFQICVTFSCYIHLGVQRHKFNNNSNKCNHLRDYQGVKAQKSYFEGCW